MDVTRSDNSLRANYLWRKARILSGLAAAACMLFAASAAEAHPIKRGRIRIESTNQTRWQAFLSGGPTLWSVERPPPIPGHIHLATSGGLLVQTPFVFYLEWRHNLDPTRFDHYHPLLGPLIETTQSAQNLPPVTIPPAPVTAPLPPPATLSGPQGCTNCPEPPAWAVALVLCGGTIWLKRGWKRRLSTRFSPERPTATD